MACKPAPACRAALNEATLLWPGRARASDGVCGDAAHASRTSDHNPKTSGPAIGHATAFDLTHDPFNGFDAIAEVRKLIERRDHRVKYVIWNRTIWRAYDRPRSSTRPFLPAWAPERYEGENPHTRHCHVSVWDEHFKTVAPWWSVPGTKEVRPMYEPPLTVAAVWKDAQDRVLAGVGPDGSVFAWGVPYRGAPKGRRYWGDSRATAVAPNNTYDPANPKSPPYVVQNHRGQWFGHGPDGFDHP